MPYFSQRIRQFHQKGGVRFRFASAIATNGRKALAASRDAALTSHCHAMTGDHGRDTILKRTGRK